MFSPQTANRRIEIRTETFRLERTENEWCLSGLTGNLDSEGLQLYDLKTSVYTRDTFCIRPSIYDKPSLLLLCSPDTIIGTREEVTEADIKQLNGSFGCQVFNLQTDLLLNISLQGNDDNRILEISSNLMLSGQKILKVMVKMCYRPADNDAFLKLAHNWSRLKAQEFLKLHGVTLANRLSMVLEYPHHGNLQTFLQKEKVPTSCKTSAVYNLVRAIIYLVSIKMAFFKFKVYDDFLILYAFFYLTSS